MNNNKEELDELEKLIDEKTKFGVKDLFKNLTFDIIAGVVFLACLWLLVYSLRSRMIDNYVSSLEPAVTIEEESKVKALKVAIDGKTYTTKEFMKLKDFPVVVEVIIAYEDGTMETKNCYVSFNDEVEDFTYRDGVYGRILLPSELYNQSSEEKEEE